MHGIDDMTEADSKVIEFKDHSEEFQTGQEKSLCKMPREVSLPDPRYIKIHAAIAGILHMSGANRFFDELLNKFGDDALAVRSWEEFDKVVETAKLRQELSVLTLLP